MAGLTLVIGNRNYSSWSLRAWMALRLAGLAFDERLIRLSEPESSAELRKLSPSGRVPVLIDGDLVIWESLAIVEYAAELAPDAGLWPSGRHDRARARAVAAEMHAGFEALREHLPMNIRRRVPLEIDGGPVADDIARITSIFRDCLERSHGPFLFGEWPGAADAMYLPVATRFRTYDVALDPASQGYVDRLLSLDAFRAWETAAEAEPWVIQSEEVAQARQASGEPPRA